MLGDNHAVCRVEAEARSAPWLLGREERFKEAIDDPRWDCGASVLDLDDEAKEDLRQGQADLDAGNQEAFVSLEQVEQELGCTK